MHNTIQRNACGLLIAAVFSASLLATPVAAQTPQPGGCEDVATPAAANHATPGMAMAQVEFDQMYIDMMLPHHGSIIALAGVALPRLTDLRLQQMAQSIIDTQAADQAELRALRTTWYGSPDPAPMDDAMMAMMTEMMPGMGSAGEQMQIMSAEWQVQTFCAAADFDLAFIDQTIPHHQMAIDASNAALQQAVHPEIRTIANEVITAQQAEIDQLTTIRAELTGAATPAT